MVILSQPAALSPAGNIKDFVISSSEVVRFRLYKGETLLLDNQYQPDASGQITVSIKDVVLSSLSVELPADNIHIQQNIAADFVANISDVNVSFRAVRCGVERWNGDISSFLWGNFLTWQPQLVETRYTQPQWLTYYNASDNQALLKVKFYLKDGSTSVISVGTVAAGECISFNTQFAHIWSLLDADKYGYYDVYVEDGSGVRLSYIQRYVLVDGSENDTLFIFENTLGGLDSVAFTGANTYAPEYTFGNVVYDECNSNAYIERTGAYSQNSGYKTKREALWLRDFFVMPNRYVVKKGTILPIVVDESSVSNSNMEQLHSFEFKYKLSDDSKYQNLARVETLAVPIEIPTPDNLFFLAPRLAEFERTVLADALLLPVQSPHYEKWYTISYGDIKAQFTDIVNVRLKPFAHTHDNLSLINNLSEAEDGSLLYKGEKIGGNSYVGDLSDLQLKIEEFSSWFELRTLANGEKVLYTKYHFVAEGELTGGGISDDLSGESGSDGVSYNRLDSWDNYNIANGDVLSAALGYSLKTDIERIQQQLDNGVLSSVTVKLGDIAYKSVNGEICLPAYPITDGLLRADVADALYTPIGYYNSIDQRVGEIEDTCITEVTSAMIISALGYTPYQSTNPNKYITSAALSDYATQVWVESKGYLTAHQDISHLLSKTEAANTYQVKGNYLSAIPDEYITDTELTNRNYATLVWVKEQRYITDVAEALGYIPFPERDFTKQNIQAVLGISDWALAELKPSYQYSEILDKPTALPASDVYDWAKAATKPTYTWSEILSKPTILSGYGITDAVLSPNGASGTTIQEYCAANPSFMSMVNIGNVWTHIISSRHRNGSGDGNNYGIYISADISSSNLIWERQYAGQWQGQRIILDSISYTDFTYAKLDIDNKIAQYLPLIGGTLTGTLSAPQINITSQNAISHLSFGRASGNYITSVSGGYMGFIPNGKSIIAANADMLISDGLIYPGTTGITSLGYGNKRWANVASVNGDFSGALTAGSFSTANVVSCGGRLRINAANSVTSFGFLKATAYSSALNRAVLDIGSNYGGSADITSEAVDVVAMSMYRGAVGVGRAFTYDELYANRNSNIMLTVAGSILTDSIKFSNGQVLSMHNDGSLHLTGNLIVDGEISTGGVSDDLGESAVSYDRLDSWDDYNASAGDVLSAVLGYGLKNDITNLANSLTSLDSRVSSLEANSGGSSTGGNYLPITGGTLSGALGISGSLTTSEDIVTNSDLTVAGNATIGIDLATTNFYASGIAEFYDMTNYYGEVYMYQDLTVDGAIYMMGDPVIASDMRYKEIVQFVSLSNDVIADAPIFKFYWEDKNDNKLHIGTSAQYWEEVDSDFISYNPRNGKLYLDYLGLTVAMGQSNAAEIRCLKLQVQKLEEVIGI